MPLAEQRLSFAKYNLIDKKVDIIVAYQRCITNKHGKCNIVANIKPPIWNHRSIYVQCIHRCKLLLPSKPLFHNLHWISKKYIGQKLLIEFLDYEHTILPRNTKDSALKGIIFLLPPARKLSVRWFNDSYGSYDIIFSAGIMQ